MTLSTASISVTYLNLTLVMLSWSVASVNQGKLLQISQLNASFKLWKIKIYILMIKEIYDFL